MAAKNEITVRIEKKHLDEYAQAKITALQNDLSKAENREKRAKEKVTKLEAELSERNGKADLLDKFVEEIIDSYEYNDRLRERFDYGGYA